MTSQPNIARIQPEGSIRAQFDPTLRAAPKWGAETANRQIIPRLSEIPALLEAYREHCAAIAEAA